MLSKESENVLKFIAECRGNRMLEDNLFKTEEKMYSNLYKVEEMLSKFPTGNDLFIELEQSIFDTLAEMRETYFEYGVHYGTVVESQPIENLIAG